MTDIPNRIRILPQDYLQRYFKVNLKYSSRLDLKKMKTEHPAAYYRLYDYWELSEPDKENHHKENHHKENHHKENHLKRLELPEPRLLTQSIHDMIARIPSRRILQHHLVLAEKIIFSELIALIHQKQLFIFYLQLLPVDETFALSFDIADLYQKLFSSAIKKLKRYASDSGCGQIVVDVYNPTLVDYFKSAGFDLVSERTISGSLKNTIRLNLNL